MASACQVLLDIAIAADVPCSTIQFVLQCSAFVNGDAAHDEGGVEPAPQSGQRASTPPASSELALAPLSINAISAAASTAAPQLSSTMAKGSKRFIGSMRNDAANTIRRAWHLHKFRSVLKSIYRHAAATKFQALFRAFCNRRDHRDSIQQRRNTWIIARYAYHRTVDLKKVPTRHVVCLAARRIQLRWRRHISHIRVAQQRRLRASVRIQRFYRRILFVRFMSTATERRVLHDRRTFAAIKIQALCRGVLTRRLCKAGAWQQWNAEAGARLAPQQRRSRQATVAAIEVEVRRQAAMDHASKTQQELLERILKAKEPNRDIVMWSAESSIPDSMELVPAVSTKGRPLTMVPLASGAAGFVSQACVMRPSATAAYLEQRSVAQDVNRVRSAKQQAASVAALAVRKRHQLLGEHPDESATTRFVLKACEGVVK